MHSYVLLQAAMLIVMLGRRGKVMLVLLDFDGRAVACGKAARSHTRIDPKLGPEAPAIGRWGRRWAEEFGAPSCIRIRRTFHVMPRARTRRLDYYFDGAITGVFRSC